MKALKVLPKKIYEEALKEVKKLPANKKDKAVKKIIKFYNKTKFEPGEAVGVVSAQSLSEPATQMSLDYSEKVIVKHKGIIKIAPIGEFVDTLVAHSTKEKDGWEVYDVSDLGIAVPSITQDEKIEWYPVKALSRHASPKSLLEIKTLSGRKITATDSHSFMIRKNNKVVPVAGKELSAGNRIPVMKFLPENCLQSLITKDIVGDVKHAKKHLPPVLELNENLGWIFGAYLAEGNSTNFYVSFSNTDPSFLSRIRKFAHETNFTFNEYDNTRGFSLGHDIRINSKQLSLLMKNTCRTGSKFKIVPDFAYSSNLKFVSGLLKGYFDGDGNVSVNRRMIRISSESKSLLDGVAILLTRFGIFSHKIKGRQFMLSIPYKYAKKFRDRIGFAIKSKAEKLDYLCLLFEKNKDSYQDYIDMIGGFDDILVNISKKLDLPSRYVNSFTKRQKIGRVCLLRHINKFERISKEKQINIEPELNILKRMINSDIVWDEIISVEKVKPTNKYVYDFTVPGSETFTTFDSIVTHNTMRTYHIAGAIQIEVRKGLPRLIEIFDARRVPSTPTMEIYLKSSYNTKEKAFKIASQIKEILLIDVSESSTIDISSQKVEMSLDKKIMREFGTNPKKIFNIMKENFKTLKISLRGDTLVIGYKKDTSMKELQRLKTKLLKAHVKGLKGIKHAIINQVEGKWIINTLGSNLSEVLETPGVDGTHTITNNIHEVEKVLGIEAARAIIIEEAKNTIKDQGLDVDIRHVMLVSDMMTAYGKIKAIGRYGIAGSKGSVLARANFEETVKHLTKASIENEVDHLDSIVENVMINQVVPAGTGMFDLVLRRKKKA